MENKFDELDRICLNCTHFFQDSENMYLGACLNDKVFEPFLDEIIETENFSCCWELYLEKRYDAEKEACDEFEAFDLSETMDEEELDAWLTVEQMKSQNVDGIIKFLYDTSIEIIDRAIATISTYVYVGNNDAYEGLLKYYVNLGPADSLEEVHRRKEIVEILSSKSSDRRTIEAFVKELDRTPSNNTTRQLYSLILNQLRSCPYNIIEELLMDLLKKKKYGQKMRERILETIDYAHNRELDKLFPRDF